MSQAKVGDKVKVHYTGKFEDGEVFDSSLEREPLEFSIGEGKLIKGFEDAIVGMEKGEDKTVDIAADNAYGPYRKEIVFDVERAKMPQDYDPKVGEQLQIPQQDGGQVIVTVTDFDDSKVTLDANHPLAGKDLTFDLKLVEIV
jgi:peptidylprolyl isomerase